MQGLSEFINHTMPEWNVPGLAIAIVKDNQIIFCEGFGLRDGNNNLKVTPKTLFAIGSCTKAFTTMAMGILVDRGQLDWDQPVRNYLPSFKLYDSYASEHITPRDLVTHRSGLPRHDAMWYRTHFTREEIINRLQYLEPTQELRTVFQYNNLMYLAAGYLVGAIAGCTWEEFVQQEILNPLGMGNSNFSVDASQKTDDFAHPYLHKNEEVKEIPFLNIDVVGPAGCINSNVTDMAQWLLLHLNGGKFSERQIISANNLRQMYTPQIVEPNPQEEREVLNPSYGLGWAIYGYRGYKVVQHGGGIDGFSALTTLLPQDNIGIVVLTNLNASPLHSIVTYYVCDRLLNLEPVAWSDRLKEKVAIAKESTTKTQEKIAAERQPGTHPGHALEDYTGNYEHPAYGMISVELKQNNLISTYNSMSSQLQHYHYDTFVSYSELAEMLDMPPDLISFVTDKKGDVTSLYVPMEPALKDAVFTRMPEKSMTEVSFLAKFVGEYELTGQTLTISLRGEGLIASLTGQPDYELVPDKDSEFNLKGLSGFSIKFTQDAAGIVSEAVINQPNGAFTATKKTSRDW
jgi:CubicO group peptidase (beta-lactamase class C family)